MCANLVVQVYEAVAQPEMKAVFPPRGDDVGFKDVPTSYPLPVDASRLSVLIRGLDHSVSPVGPPRDQ